MAVREAEPPRRPPIRIGNVSGFYGDRFSAVHEMLTGGLFDVLTGLDIEAQAAPAVTTQELTDVVPPPLPEPLSPVGVWARPAQEWRWLAHTLNLEIPEPLL